MIKLSPKKIMLIKANMIISIILFAMAHMIYFIFALLFVFFDDVLDGQKLLILLPIVMLIIGNINLMNAVITGLIIRNKGFVSKKQLNILFWSSLLMLSCLLYGLFSAIVGISLYASAYKRMENIPRGKVDYSENVNYFMTSHKRFDALVATIFSIASVIAIYTFAIIYTLYNKFVVNTEIRIIPIIVFAVVSLSVHILALITTLKIYRAKNPATEKSYNLNLFLVGLISIIFISVPIFSIFIVWYFMELIFKKYDFKSQYTIDEINSNEEFEKWNASKAPFLFNKGYINLRGVVADDYDENGKFILYKERENEQN